MIFPNVEIATRIGRTLSALPALLNICKLLDCKYWRLRILESYIPEKNAGYTRVIRSHQLFWSDDSELAGEGLAHKIPTFMEELTYEIFIKIYEIVIMVTDPMLDSFSSLSGCFTSLRTSG